MSATQVAPTLLSWASDIEPGTIEQAARTSRLPFVEGHVALMPDAHVGIGSTVGSVIPTRGGHHPELRRRRHRLRDDRHGDDAHRRGPA